MTKAILRPLAATDLLERSRYHRTEGGLELGLRFFAAAWQTLNGIEQMPGMGSLRIGERCGVPGLRSRRVADFPCGWFYVERNDHVDIIRLLAYTQDLILILGDELED